MEKYFVLCEVENKILNTAEINISLQRMVVRVITVNNTTGNF